MPTHVIVAAAAVAAAVPLLWYSVSGAGGTIASGGFIARLRGKKVAVPDMHQIALERSASDRVLRPVMDGLAKRVRRFTPLGWIKNLERKIALAGMAPHALERFLVLKLLILGGVGLALVTALRSSKPALWALITIVIGLVAYFAPDLSLGSRARERQNTIQIELPDVLDQMMISVEAGLGFEAALGRAGKTGTGPLAVEIIRSMQEMQMGVPRRQALHNLANRNDVPDLRNFVFAVVQSEQYGLPIAHTLRVQAAELRDKRRQRAEEKAFKIPVKIVFPLILCIFPALFIVLLGPAGLRMYRALFG